LPKIKRRESKSASGFKPFLRNMQEDFGIVKTSQVTNNKILVIDD